MLSPLVNLHLKRYGLSKLVKLTQFQLLRPSRTPLEISKWRGHENNWPRRNTIAATALSNGRNITAERKRGHLEIFSDSCVVISVEF